MVTSEGATQLSDVSRDSFAVFSRKGRVIAVRYWLSIGQSLAVLAGTAAGAAVDRWNIVWVALADRIIITACLPCGSVVDAEAARWRGRGRQRQHHQHLSCLPQCARERLERR